MFELDLANVVDESYRLLNNDHAQYRFVIEKIHQINLLMFIGKQQIELQQL